MAAQRVQAQAAQERLDKVLQVVFLAQALVQVAAVQVQLGLEVHQALLVETAAQGLQIQYLDRASIMAVVVVAVQQPPLEQAAQVVAAMDQVLVQAQQEQPTQVAAVAVRIVLALQVGQVVQGR